MQELVDSEVNQEFMLSTHIGIYKDLYKACMEREMYNVISKLINSVVLLEQRVAGAGAVLSGGIQSW